MYNEARQTRIRQRLRRMNAAMAVWHGAAREPAAAKSTWTVAVSIRRRFFGGAAASFRKATTSLSVYTVRRRHAHCGQKPSYM